MSRPDAAGREDRDWQRVDKWLWCARFMKQRADCVRLVAAGSLRINRQPTEKPHAKLRVGDTLTLAIGRQVRVIVVEALAERRGAAEAARTLYRELPEGSSPAGPPGTCEASGSAAYRPFCQIAGRPDTRSA